MRFAIVAVAASLMVAGAAQALNTFEPQETQGAEAAPELRRVRSEALYNVQPVSTTGGVASVVKSPDGHFWAEGLVNGKRVRFLVDTGASAVALTLADAHRLGFTTADLVYSAEVDTANGKARVARVSLDSVSIAGARVPGVEAFVVEKGLETSLLGMTYLGRLSRFEATQSSLILRP